MRGKKKKQREEMCLTELDKQIKTRKYMFLLVYCITLVLGYLGFVLTYDVSQILAGYFIVLIFGMFTIISHVDYLYTRLLKYLKYHLED